MKCGRFLLELVNLFSLWWYLSQGGRWESTEVMESFRGGGSTPFSGFESCAKRAPPVGWGFCAVEGCGNSGQANRNLSVRVEQHGPPSFQRFCGSQVSLTLEVNIFSSLSCRFKHFIEFYHLNSACSENTKLALISLSKNWICSIYAQLPTSSPNFQLRWKLSSLITALILEHMVY